MTYIYVMQRKSGPCKIGVSKNVKTRLMQLNTASFEPITLEYWADIDGDGAYHVEGMVHELLKYNLHGEWFSVQIYDAIKAIAHATNEAGFVLREYYEPPKRKRQQNASKEALLVRFPQELIEKLDVTSNKLGLSRAAFLRMLCNQYFEKEAA